MSCAYRPGFPGTVKDGVLHELKGASAPVIAGLFRARLLKVLLEEGVISQQIVDLLLTWNHHSGFNVHARGRIHGADDCDDNDFMVNPHMTDNCTNGIDDDCDDLTDGQDPVCFQDDWAIPLAQASVYGSSFS